MSCLVKVSTRQEGRILNDLFKWDRIPSNKFLKPITNMELRASKLPYQYLTFVCWTTKDPPDVPEGSWLTLWPPTLNDLCTWMQPRDQLNCLRHCICSLIPFDPIRLSFTIEFMRYLTANKRDRKHNNSCGRIVFNFLNIASCHGQSQLVLMVINCVCLFICLLNQKSFSIITISNQMRVAIDTMCGCN